MALLNTSASAGHASRNWRTIRLLGAAIIGGGLLGGAMPALADQNLMVADNGTVNCDASLKDLTRIALKDDQFASVSKVQVGSPTEDFQVVNEPLRGDIYISVASGFAKPAISFFGTTRKGFVYKFVCTVAGSEAKQVFIANTDVEHPRAMGEQWPTSLSTQETATRLIAAMYEQNPVEGYDISWRALTPVVADGVRVQFVGQYVGPLLTGKLLKLANVGTKPITLREEQVGPADAVAISITNPRLAPGKETTAFVVQSSAQAGDRP